MMYFTWVILTVFIVSVSAVLRDRTFAGKYSDPNHPGCARQIVGETRTSARVYGADAAGGEGATCNGETDEKWGPLPAKVNGEDIIVDFSSKGGPSNLSGKYDDVNQAIDWEDGNSW
eukprot:CAMPEP_0170388946 /NCGR_PEP_ID=MMETSP0117_2-20130122/18359_1 /TAXON_ID=400756 /ORGANISM="Durinskia baltica, Strain CSIRO CS-38" /LENGTH=116 /DNA_ID=CAMNT_0010644909 /DNA_START=45 /DNA_END=392 /DNA_ORIENTATION=-